MKIERLPDPRNRTLLGTSRSLEQAEYGVCFAIGLLLAGGFGLALAELLFLVS